MSKPVAKFSGWVLGLLVVGALAFGLSVATATPATAMTCPNDGWNWVGQQPSQAACTQACLTAHYPQTDVVGQWHPSTGCCTCLY